MPLTATQFKALVTEAGSLENFLVQLQEMAKVEVEQDEVAKLPDIPVGPQMWTALKTALTAPLGTTLNAEQVFRRTQNAIENDLPVRALKGLILWYRIGRQIYPPPPAPPTPQPEV